jgi:cytochrome c nitrite reductase accessory protein NrfF
MLKHWLLLLCLLLSPWINAQIVDTWAFANTEQQELALTVAGQLRCPQCQNQNLLESNSPVAVTMRQQVFLLVEQGKGQQDIIDAMTQRYGNFVRYDPPFNWSTALLWSAPLLIALMLALVIYLQRQTPQPTIAHHSHLQPPPVQPIGKNYYSPWLILGLLATTVIYTSTGRWQAVHQEWQRQNSPATNNGNPQLLSLQQRLQTTPQDGRLWAELGEYYLYQDAYAEAFIAYQQAIKYGRESAELLAAQATVIYYQNGQRLTPQVREWLDKALARDQNEVAALMILASDAFSQRDYAHAIALWQQILDLNSPRSNRAALIESINTARQLQR